MHLSDPIPTGPPLFLWPASLLNPTARASLDVGDVTSLCVKHGRPLPSSPLRPRIVEAVAERPVKKKKGCEELVRWQSTGHLSPAFFYLFFYVGACNSVGRNEGRFNLDPLLTFTAVRPR